MRRNLNSLVGACCLLFYISPAQAIMLIDRWVDDQNTIRFSDQSNSDQILYWEEDYNEDDLIPYPSPDGYAVVNASGDPGCQAGTESCYFDKIFNLEGENGIWEFQVGVFNTSPFDWSGFHLEFYDATFQTRLDNMLLDSQNGIFPVVDTMADAVWFSGGTQFAGSEFLQNFISLRVNLDGIGPEGSFGIRQVATTVPESTTLALLSISFVALGFTRHRMQT